MGAPFDAFRSDARFGARVALAMFDGDLRVVLRNAEAEALIAQGLLSIDAHGRFAGALGRKLRARLATPQDEAPLVLGVADRREIYFGAVVTPVLPVASGGRGLFALLVRDALAELRDKALAVARRHGLTEREKRMLVLIVEGYDPSRAARDLGVARSTARTHLQRVFDKIGVTRQSALVSFVARSPGGEMASI